VQRVSCGMLSAEDTESTTIMPFVGNSSTKSLLMRSSISEWDCSSSRILILDGRKVRTCFSP